VRNYLNNILAPIFNIFFPNRCLFCGSLLEEGSCICDRCISIIEIIETDFCKVCGAPILEMDKNDVDLSSCFQCRSLIFSFRKNESLAIFSGIVRRLIHEYKFNRRRSLSKLFGNLLVKYKKEYILDHDLIVPMPLSVSRFSERGFNQSNLVAEEISKSIPVQYYGEVLDRKGKSKPQSSIYNLKERFSNLRDKFYVKKKYWNYINNSNILIIDDVVTTGATASVCADVLLKEGAKNVDILSIARAVKEQLKTVDNEMSLYRNYNG